MEVGEEALSARGGVVVRNFVFRFFWDGGGSSAWLSACGFEASSLAARLACWGSAPSLSPHGSRIKLLSLLSLLTTPG